MITTGDAIISLRPNASWVLRGDALTWLDEKQTEPTSTELATEKTRLQAEYDNNKYQRDREPLYPSLGDFADAMYWNSKGDDTKLKEYYEACEKVKSDNPKP